MTTSTTNPLTTRFGSIAVIGLAERTDRRQETVTELVRIGQDPGKIDFFLAVKPQDRGAFPSAGVRGAFESHLKMLSQAANEGQVSVLVLEDDVEFARNFEQQQSIIDQLPSDWDMLYIGHDSEKPRPMPETGRRLRRCQPDEEFIGLHCYAINGKILSAVVQQLQQFPVNGDPDKGIIPMPVDGALNVIRRLSPSIKCFLVEPPLANQRSSRTDIADLKWFDKSKLLEGPVSLFRRVKNKLRN